MGKKYICLDWEASGTTPGKYSGIALGACIVGDIEEQFYRELKPISENYIHSAMQIGCLHLECLRDKKDIELNPKNRKFSPKKVLEILAEEGEDPEDVMCEFANWININTIGHTPIEVANPIKFDGMFTSWYFDNFYNGINPLGYGGEDIDSVYRGLRKDMDVNVARSFGLRRVSKQHHALEDAIVQAKEFEKVLNLMKK